MGLVVIAYKFLRPGGVGPFSGFAWPLPDGAEPGEWVTASTDAAPCRDGIHACERRHLPRWIWEELWEVELEGPVQECGSKLRAPHGRLLRRVDAWGVVSAKRFAAACAERAAEQGATDFGDAAVAAELAADCGAMVAATREAGDPRTAARTAALCSYIAAMAALRAGGRDRHEAERDRQAEWLAAELDLPV